jgi:hypothetical protein
VTAQIVKITDETTRADLADTLAILNAEAMRISRRGKVGTLSDDYRLRHEYINSVLSDWEQAPA